MNILYVNACTRKESITHKLALYALKKLQGTIEEINLDTIKLSPLYKEKLELRDSFVQNKNFDHPMFEFAKQFAKADIVLISAPYWDLSFPSILKTYIENINVNGITFSYSPQGYPVSLCNAKRLVYITTAGGPIISNDFGFGYIKSLAENFYGIKNIDYIKAEGLDIYGADIQKIIEKTKKDIDKLV